MQQIIPRILTENSRRAISFYQGIFGGEILEFFTNSNGVCAHAALHIREAVTLYFADGKADPGGVHLCLALHDADETRKIYAYLRQGGREISGLAPTGWALLTGSLADKYGVVWEFNCGSGTDARYQKV